MAVDLGLDHRHWRNQAEREVTESPRQLRPPETTNKDDHPTSLVPIEALIEKHIKKKQAKEGGASSNSVSAYNSAYNNAFRATTGLSNLY